MENRIIDPVCGMDVAPFPDAKTFSQGGTTFLFCGEMCEERFKKNPARYQGEPLIRLVDIWKTFLLGAVKVDALRGLDLHIWPGDFVALIGASGSGKSTALHLLGLLDRPTKGKMFISGGDVSALGDEERARRRVQTFGFMFQQYNLVPWLSAYENITLPLIFARRRGRSHSGEAEARRAPEEALINSRLSGVGMGDRRDHRPYELSGGEQQRVAFLRALVNDPAVLLCDEPTGNLDSATGEKVLEMLISLNREQKKTLVIVTHDAHIAARADQVITIKDGRVLRDHRVYQKMYTE